MVTDRPLPGRVSGGLGLLGLALALLLAPALPAGQEPLGLADAIRRALAQNRDVRRSALAADSAALSVGAARSDFDLVVRPEGTLGASQGLGNLAYGLTVSKRLPWGTELSAAGMESSSAALGTYQDSVQLELRQPIRNFGELMQGAAIAQASSGSQTARRRSDGKRSDTVLRVVEAYEAVGRGRRQLAASQASVRRMDSLHQLTRAKELLGRTTGVDSLRVELLRGQALSRLEIAAQRLATAGRELAVLLGAAPDAAFEVGVLAAVATPPPDQALRVARERRLDLAQARQDLADAEREAAIAQRGLWPDLSAVAQYQRFGTSPSVWEARRLPETIWFVGLSGAVELSFERRRVAVQQARLAAESAGQAVESLQIAVEQQVQEALQARQRAEAEAAIREENARLAQARARLAHALFELGRVDAFGVTDAEESDLRAEDELLVARGEADLATYRVRHALGTLLDVPAELDAAGGSHP